MNPGPRLALRTVLPVLPVLPLLAGLAGQAALAQGIAVPPYYQPASGAGAHQVAVAPALDRWLASPHLEPVLQARDAIAAEPGWASPLALMVLAVRLHDLGRPDEASLWFHAARYRWVSVNGLLDTQAPNFGMVASAMARFTDAIRAQWPAPLLCGPTRPRALQWVKDHPYQATLSYQLAARPGLREQNLAQGLQRLQALVASGDGCPP